MAITAVVTIALFTLVGQSTDSYAQTQRAVNTLSQARAFVHFFEREISTRLPGMPLLHQVGVGGSPDSADKIAFVRTLSFDEQNEATPGDLGTSAYYVAFTADRSNTVSPKLFRISLNPADTQTLLESPATPDFPAPNPDTDEAIVSHVLDFRAVPKFHDPVTGELVDWQENSPAPPSIIALSIRFIDDAAAQRFTSQADWNRIATNPRDNEHQFIRSFSRIISIAK